MIENEAILIRQCQSGCQESLDRLYRKYRFTVLQVARKIMRDEQDAEDAAQEVFVRILTKIDQFRYEASFSWWITILTSNVCRDMLRKRNLYPTESLEDLCLAGNAEMSGRASSVSQEEELIMRELLENLQGKIGRLKKEYQRLIVLRYIDGLSYRKIAQLVGCSETLVKSRLHQARKNLKRICQDLRVE